MQAVCPFSLFHLLYIFATLLYYCSAQGNFINPRPFAIQNDYSENPLVPLNSTFEIKWEGVTEGDLRIYLVRSMDTPGAYCKNLAWTDVTCKPLIGTPNTRLLVRKPNILT